MNPKIEALATDLEALRAEMLELDAVEEPTEEQATRFAAALVEWDEKEAEHTALVARAEKIEAVRTAALNPKNIESGSFAGRNVVVKQDPFENVRSLAFSRENVNEPRMTEDIVARAVTALSDYRMRGVSDDAIQEAVRKVETVPGAAQYALIHHSPAYRAAFNEYMNTGGKPMYSPEQADAIRASMALGSTTGGAALPTLLDPTLIHTGTATKNPLRSISRVESGTQNVWHGVSVGNVVTYWKGEGSAFTDGSPTFAAPTVTAALLSAYVIASYEIFEDSGLQSQIPGLISEAMGYKEGTAFISGSGSTAPKGIVTAISATVASTVTATTRGAFTSASPADVYAVLNALPSRYEDSATWVANKATFNIIRQMSNAANGSLFWTNFNDDALGRQPLLGSPIVQSSDMATTTTTGTVLAILGDFRQFLIYDRIGTTVEFVQNVVDTSGLPTGQRGILAHKRVGSDITDVNAFRFLLT